MSTPLKLSEAVAADISARIRAFDFEAIEKVRKAKDANGTFDVIISTEDVDRAGDMVMQDGWQLENYKNNPIVLWGHDYYSLPIGICTETYLTTSNGKKALGAKGVFLPADINPFAQQVRKLYDFGMSKGVGVGCTTSVGFIPREFDPNSYQVITRAELLEFSFVPVPANQGVGPAEGRALTLAEARALGINPTAVRAKGLEFLATLGAIPESRNEKIAPASEAWTAPTLKTFTEKAWNELSASEKAAIASHFAYSRSADFESFEDLQLPYRNAKGEVVLAGLKAAMKALLSEKSTIAEEGDRKAAYDRLAAQYRLFNKTAPEFALVKEAQIGDTCTMDDGTNGVFASDPNDPDGPLVCVPDNDDKGVTDEHASEKALIKALADEHERHAAQLDKSVETFKDVASGDGTSEDEEEKAQQKKTIVQNAIKALSSELEDEQTMHRAKTIAAFRGFDPAEKKGFDKSSHLKALREAHDTYEAKCAQILEEFFEKDADPEEDRGAWIESKLDGASRAHKRQVSKLARAMCKEAFGEEEQADEKTLSILKEYLAPHVSEQLLPPLAAKIGTRLAAERRNMLGEAHSHLKAATAVLEELSGALADSSEEVSRSASGTHNAAGTGSREHGSRPRTTSRTDDEALKAHLMAREIVGGIEAVAREALGQLNAEVRARSRK